MPILQIEHQVADFNSWKRNAFDPDPLGRDVRSHRITRNADDANHVMIELEFAMMPEAEAMQGALRNLWRNPLAEIGAPTARIIETVEAKQY